MIVDDEPIERIGIKKMVERSFLNLDILEDAKNGLEAIEKARANKPNIILMDIRMPKKTGLEAQKEIISFLPKVQTIILTAYSDFNFAQEAIKYGVADFLLKPVRPTELKVSIEKTIDYLTRVDVQAFNQQNELSYQDSNPIAIVIKYIERNISEEITLANSAKVVHLSPQYLSRYFKKETGLTFTEYVTKVKIERAKKLITQTNKPVYRIALELGFNDAAYFSKVFLKYAKVTPLQFKKNYEKQI